MLQRYRRVETHPKAVEEGDARHGSSGPIRVAPLDHPWHHPEGAAHKVTHAFVAAYVEEREREREGERGRRRDDDE